MSVYVCPKCKSLLSTNHWWEEHMKSHLRLEQIEKDLERYGPLGVESKLWSPASTP